jgi:protein-disulfide isomerase
MLVADPLSLVGSIVLTDLRIDELMGADGALATYAATSEGDGQSCTVRVALGVSVSPEQDTAVASAFGRVTRHALGIRGLCAPRAAGAVAVGSERLLAIAHAGCARDSAEALVAARSALELSRVISLLQPVAQALCALHGQGLVHGALHPAAIGADRSGPLLSAYGLSDIALGLGGATAARDVVPPRSRVPEQVGIVAASPGPESDTYALAMIACELLVGRPFTDEKDPSSIARAIDNPVLRPTPAAMSVSLPAHAEAAFAIALRTQPRERTLDPKTFLDALQTAPAQPSATEAGHTPPAPRSGSAASTQSALLPEPPVAQRPARQRSAPSDPSTQPSARAEARQSRASLWLVWAFISLGIVLLVGGAVVVFVLAMSRTPPASMTSTGPSSGILVPAAPETVEMPAEPPTADSGVANRDPPAAELAAPSASGASAAGPPGGSAAPKAAGAGLAIWPEDTTALIPIAKETPVVGTREAPVTVMIFADMQCPHTRRARVALDKLMDRFGADLRVAVRHLPIPSHEHAELGAEIAACTGAIAGPTALWRLMTTLTDNHSSLTDAAMLRWAQEAGAPANALQRAIQSHSWLHVVEADRNLAGRLMVRATPTLFINGKRMDGLESEAVLAEAVDKERLAARKALGSGTPKPKLYSSRVTFNVTSAAADPSGPH